MCALGTVFNGIDVNAPLGNIFLGYLIGTEDAAGLVLSDFPVLNWFIFPVFGYVFGHILKRVKNKDLFYLVFSLPAMIIAIIYFTYSSLLPSSSMNCVLTTNSKTMSKLLIISTSS